MKAIFNLKKSIYYVAAFAVTVSMVSCDDDNSGETKPLTLGDVAGTYEGKMYVEAQEEEPSTEPAERADEPAGLAISGTFEQNKATFENFPVNSFIAAIEGKEAVEAIIESMEDIKYTVEFDSKLNEAQDSIFITLEPKALEFSYEIAEGEGEDATKVTKDIAVTLKASENGSSYSKKTVELNLISESIKVDDVALEGYEPEYVIIDLKKK